MCKMKMMNVIWQTDVVNDTLYGQSEARLWHLRRRASY